MSQIKTAPANAKADTKADAKTEPNKALEKLTPHEKEEAAKIFKEHGKAGRDEYVSLVQNVDLYNKLFSGDLKVKYDAVTKSVVVHSEKQLSGIDLLCFAPSEPVPGLSFKYAHSERGTVKTMYDISTYRKDVLSKFTVGDDLPLPRPIQEKGSGDLSLAERAFYGARNEKSAEGAGFGKLLRELRQLSEVHPENGGSGSPKAEPPKK